MRLSVGCNARSLLLVMEKNPSSCYLRVMQRTSVTVSLNALYFVRSVACSCMLMLERALHKAIDKCKVQIPGIAAQAAWGDKKPRCALWESLQLCFEQSRPAHQGDPVA